jgi:hypothetical protein
MAVVVPVVHQQILVIWALDLVVVGRLFVMDLEPKISPLLVQAVVPDLSQVEEQEADLWALWPTALLTLVAVAEEHKLLVVRQMEQSAQSMPEAFHRPPIQVAAAVAAGGAAVAVELVAVAVAARAISD